MSDAMRDRHAGFHPSRGEYVRGPSGAVHRRAVRSLGIELRAGPDPVGRRKEEQARPLRGAMSRRRAAPGPRVIPAERDARASSTWTRSTVAPSTDPHGHRLGGSRRGGARSSSSGVGRPPRSAVAGDAEQRRLWTGAGRPPGRAAPGRSRAAERTPGDDDQVWRHRAGSDLRVRSRDTAVER